MTRLPARLRAFVAILGLLLAAPVATSRAQEPFPRSYAARYFAHTDTNNTDYAELSEGALVFHHGNDDATIAWDGSSLSLSPFPALVVGTTTYGEAITFDTGGDDAELRYFSGTDTLDFDGFLESDGLFVPAGTAADPEISTAADPDTGLFFPAPDVAGLGAGGNDTLLVQPSAVTVDGSLLVQTVQIVDLGGGGFVDFDSAGALSPALRLTATDNDGTPDPPRFNLAYGTTIDALLLEGTRITFDDGALPLDDSDDKILEWQSGPDLFEFANAPLNLAGNTAADGLQIDGTFVVDGTRTGFFVGVESAGLAATSAGSAAAPWLAEDGSNSGWFWTGAGWPALSVLGVQNTVYQDDGPVYYLDDGATQALRLEANEAQGITWTFDPEGDAADFVYDQLTDSRFEFGAPLYAGTVAVENTTGANPRLIANGDATTGFALGTGTVYGSVSGVETFRSLNIAGTTYVYNTTTGGTFNVGPSSAYYSADFGNNVNFTTPAGAADPVLTFNSMAVLTYDKSDPAFEFSGAPVEIVSQFLKQGRPAQFTSTAQLSFTLDNDDEVIPVTNSATVALTNSGGAIPSDRNFTLAGGAAGDQRVVLVSINGGVELLDGAGSGSGAVELSADWTPGTGDTLTLWYSTAASQWLEITRSDN